MTQKSYVKGDAFPELKKDTLRLYNMRFCPFAQRTRLVLAHKNIPFETINVNLKEKPDWFFKKNPLGKVPVLEINDLVIYESAICNDYLDEVYPDKPLNPKDPYVKARHGILKENFSQWITNYYKFLRTKEQEALDIMYRVAEEFEQLVEGKPFFGGSEPTMLDYHMWPWFERRDVPMFEGKLLPQDRFPNLTSWFNNMLQTEAVKATMFDASTHHEFYKGYMTGKPNYDIGLEE